nr:hypothetical protein [uncultured Solibaculum sp.]
MHIEEGGRIVLKAKLFVEMLARLEGEMVSFKQYGSEVWISSGSATYTVMSMPPDAFPKLSEECRDRVPVIIVLDKS